MGGICSSESVVTPESDETSQSKEPVQKGHSEHHRKENINRRRLASRMSLKQTMKKKEDRGKTREHVVGTHFGDELNNYKPKKIEKSIDHKTVIRKSLESHFLFSSLPFSQIDHIIDAMEIEKSSDGDVIIKQGDEGDKFYVILEGTFDIYVNGVMVVSYSAGQNFGELALMYNCPRAATIKSNGNGVLFVLDRIGFHYFMKHTSTEINHDVTEFVSSISFLASLSDTDLQSLIDSFTLTKFRDGETIIKQGDKGDIFYIIEEGQVEVQKNGKSVITLSRGDFFGERALMESTPRQASCFAKGPVSCLALLRDEFNAIIGKHLASELDTTHKKRLEIEQSTTIGSSVGSSDASSPHSRHEPRELMKCALSDFEVKTIIGKGAFGLLKLVSYKPKKEPMAMKQMQKARIVMTKQGKNVLQEKRLLAELDHPFLLRLIATLQDKDCLYLITEFLQGGDIFGKLCDCAGIFSVATTRFYTACVIEAFSYIHKKNIIYRDLKPENLVLTHKGTLKIVDFGMAKRVDHITFTVCGTPEYMAPEIIHGKGHNRGVDYWALGILVYEMVVGHTPFADPSGSHLKIYKKIDKHCQKATSRSSGRSRNGVPFPAWLDEEKEIIDLVLKFLIPKPTMRLGVVKGGAENVRKHAWFRKTKFDWKALCSGELKPPIVPQVDDKWDASHFDEFDADVDEIVPYESQGIPLEKSWDLEF